MTSGGGIYGTRDGIRARWIRSGDGTLQEYQISWLVYQSGGSALRWTLFHAENREANKPMLHVSHDA